MTVGLVIVSHSAQLAAGVVELAEQMTQGKTRLAAAGGGPENVLGTAADKILEAIEAVDGPDGVLILLDLGSAILSTELALELRDPDQASPIQLTYAPLVEGTIAAALEAALGRPLQQVKQAAEQAASAQQLRQLKPLSDAEEAEEPAEPAPSPPPSPEAALASSETQVTLRNPAGLHARPASLFVQTAARFQAQIQVLKGERTAPATSIVAVLGLGARQNDTLIIRATGPDSSEALTALTELVNANFYETNTTTAQLRTQTTEIVQSSPKSIRNPDQTREVGDPWHGITASPGAALGPAWLYLSDAISLQSVPAHTVSDIQAEQGRLRAALDGAAQELQRLADEVRQSVGKDEGGIFDAQALMLQDPALYEGALRTITEQRHDAASALAQAGEEQAHILAQLNDPLLAARASDVRDAVSRALRHLGIRNEQAPSLSQLTRPVILVARDLTPSDTAQLRPELVLGICTTQGGPTAHSAIIARALGIPALAGLDESALASIQNGAELGLDADAALLYSKPSREIREQLSQRISAQQKKRAAQQQVAQQAKTPLVVQGRHIQLFANVGTEVEASAARQWGAEGIGLLRTEFLFGGAETLPDEEAQYQRYLRVFRAFLADESAKDKPIVVRTLDAGADKPFPALEAVIGPMKEPNPALGLRGLRIHLAHEELLEQQLSACLRAAGATGTELHVMFPMVTTVEELRSARAIFDRVYQKLKAQQVTIPAQVPVGIMVEVPAAAVMATELAENADFFSIGANDLLQYTLASDRTNSAVSYLYNPMQPAVLRLIRQIAEAGRKAGKPVAVCGEIASDVRLAPILVGLGVDELSMAPTALPDVRTVLEQLGPPAINTAIEQVLQAATVAEVEEVCKTLLSQRHT